MERYQYMVCIAACIFTTSVVVESAVPDPGFLRELLISPEIDACLKVSYGDPL